MAQTNSEENWQVLRTEIMETFTPGTPINETELFAGRQETIQQLQDIVTEPGRHAVIYGGRGIGKTSIANTFYRPLHRVTRPIAAERINCDAADTFDSLWRKVFKRLKSTGANGEDIWLDQTHPQPITPDDVVTALGSFNAAICPIIILDEFDRLRDESCKNLTADMIKALSDFTVNCTMIIVGVAHSISSLIASHASITRTLVQVPMQKMTMHELEAILTTRAKRLGMTFDASALWRITYLSAGLPFFTHSLGKYAALIAVKAKRRKILEADVHTAMKDCLADVDYSMRESFVKATERIYRKQNLFSQVLAACALADMDSLGRFTAVSVEKPLTSIMGKEMKSAAFGFHLNELARPERGAVLEKTGERRTYRFQFTDPRMQPYIVMQSLDAGIITNDVLTEFTVKPQRELFSSI